MTSSFDEIKRAVIEKCAGGQNVDVDEEYLFSLSSYLPNHYNSTIPAEELTENHTCSCCGECDIEINADLMFVFCSDAYLAAMSTLLPERRLAYLNVILDCSQPNHTLTVEDIDDTILDFLYAAQLIDIHENQIPITTKEGIYFLYRFLTSEDLSKEFH
ncbi:MAG: hypothetical protein R2685_10565 [Candidatus Nitrosocosmicus sp.]|nr:hypothetical protein [Candidatus Nitrosocosmicus sp.]